MSLYPPPRENLPIFDSSNFEINNTALTVDSGLEYFLAFPTAQGEETLANTIVAGSLTALGTANFASTTLGSLTSSAIQPPSNDSSTKIPTTAWVQTAVSGGGGAAPNLSQVLLAGSSAGATSINMNNNNVSNCQSVQAKTFNMLNNTNALTGSYITNTVGGQFDFESVGLSPTNINTSYRFSLRGTNPSVPIYPLQLTSTANNMNVPLNMNTNAISNVTTLNLSGILTTTNAIDMTGTSTILNNISTRQLSLKDATNGNSNGSSILTNGNVLTVDSVPSSGNNSLIQFALRNTATPLVPTIPLTLSTTINNMNVPLDMTGGNSTLSTISSRVYNFKDVSTGASTTTRIYQDGLDLALDNTQLNSSIIFQTRTSGNVLVTPLSIQSSQMTANVPLDMINTDATTFGYLNASIRSRIYLLRNLTTSAITSCGMYFSSNILQIDSDSGVASTDTSLFLRTKKASGTSTNALQLTNTTVKTDCYAVTPLPANDNSNSIPTTTWVQSLLSSYIPPSTIRRASSAGVFNPSGGNQIFNVNITGSGPLTISPPNLWLQDQGVTFRVNYFQSFNPRTTSGGVPLSPFDSQNYISFASTLTLYPFRFNTVNWLSTGGGGSPSQPRGRVSDNVITGSSGDNTNYVVLDSFSPSGRQFWASDISFQSNGSFLGRLYIYGGATINDVVFLLSKPNGFQAANENYTYNFSVELLNQSNTVSAITSSGFNISNL